LEVLTVERGTVELTVTGDGTLQPRTTVQVKSYAGGRVDVLAVDVGDLLQAGDLIARIDPTDSLAAYDQAAADLTAAQARLRQAQQQAAVQPRLTTAAIAQAEASYNVALTDLARMREATHPQARTQARASLTTATANLELAQRELERAQGLRARGFVAESELDVALNQRARAEGELASAQQRWDTLDQELAAELEASEARVTQARASLDRAQADAIQDELRQADVASAEAQVARAQAAVTNAQTALDYTTITAPRDGVILQKYVEEGTFVTSGRSSISQGTDIVLLGDISEMFVEVTLDEADVGLLEIGHVAAVTVDAFIGEQFRARVTRIDPQAVTDQNVTTVLVTVQIDGVDERLKPGMTAGCEFFAERAEDVLFLPNRAFRESDGQQTVLVRQGEEVVPIPVEVGIVGDTTTEIRGGLNEGDEVVLPSLGAPSDDREDWARERGRRMGGAGGFIQSGR
jgi:HlyD family secretion protein